MATQLRLQFVEQWDFSDYLFPQPSIRRSCPLVARAAMWFLLVDWDTPRWVYRVQRDFRMAENERRQRSIGAQA